MKKRILATVSLILAIILTYWGALWILVDRSDDGAMHQFECFYEQPRESVDVLFVGSSRVFCNVEPSVLWRDFGISSYDLATNSQHIHLSYYAIKEALKYQKPKVIALEMSKRDHTDKYDDDDQTMAMQSGMRFSLNKMQALFDHSDPEHRMSYLLELPCYHSRYKELSKEDFLAYDFKNMYPGSGKSGHKGGVELFNINGFDAFPEEITLNTEPSTERFLTSMDKIKKLCEENGVKLLLFTTPDIYRSEYQCAKDYAQDNDIPYINCNEYLDELSMNSHEDFADDIHLNYLGAAKVADFLGRYLKENYKLADHRGDSYFASWDENLSYVDSKLKDAKMRYITGMDDFIKDCPDEDHMVIVSLLGDYGVDALWVENSLETLGINMEEYVSGGTYVLNGSKVDYYSPFALDMHFGERVGNRVFKFDEKNGERQVLFDGVDYAVRDEDGNLVQNGIEIIVYNKRSQSVADAVCFDSHNDYSIVRNLWYTK